MWRLFNAPFASVGVLLLLLLLLLFTFPFVYLFTQYRCPNFPNAILISRESNDTERTIDTTRYRDTRYAEIVIVTGDISRFIRSRFTFSRLSRRSYRGCYWFTQHLIKRPFYRYVKEQQPRYRSRSIAEVEKSEFRFFIVPRGEMQFIRKIQEGKGNGAFSLYHLNVIRGNLFSWRKRRRRRRRRRIWLNRERIEWIEI